MQDRQRTNLMESAGLVVRTVVLLLLLAGPVLWALLGDIHTVERVNAKIDVMREWLLSEFARLK
jgi:hypothetical protein